MNSSSQIHCSLEWRSWRAHRHAQGLGHSIHPSDNKYGFHLPEEKLEFECFYSHIGKLCTSQPQQPILRKISTDSYSFFLCSSWMHLALLNMYSPSACWITSLAHNMMRKGKLFWSQRMRQRSSENELLGSDSKSASGGSSSVSELDRGCAWLRPCGWEREWLWELTLHLLDEEPPVASPLLMCTRVSLLSAAAATGTGGLVTSSGCRVRVKPLPAWAPSSFRLGCITAGVSLGLSALLE